MKHGWVFGVWLLFSSAAFSREPLVPPAPNDSNDWELYCVGDRPFKGELGFNFRAERFTLQNAYWLSVLSYDAYLDKDKVIPEFQRFGFKNNESEESEDHLEFLDEDGKMRLEMLGSSELITYANTQAVWAENSEGVILAFRGTTPGVKADMLTNLPGWPSPTRATGKLHTGFMAGLAIVWDDLYRKTLQLRRRDFAEKFKILDRISALSDEAAGPELERLAEWKIPLQGKLNFLKQWRALKLKPKPKLTEEESLDDLLKFLNVNWKTKQKPIWITGHSLGGALAQIATVRLLIRGFNVGGLYTYGSPRAGDHTFKHILERTAFENGIRENIVRFVNDIDGVARVPPLMGYVQGTDWEHVGRLKYFSGGDAVELLTDDEETKDLPQYLKDLPFTPKEWIADHGPGRYVEKIEQLVFRKKAECP